MTKHKRRAYASTTVEDVNDKSKTSAASSNPDLPPKPDAAMQQFPATVTVQTDKESVVKIAYAHNTDKKYTKEKKMMTANISKLDDITAYDISEQEEGMLWKIEIDRLLASVHDPEVSLSATCVGASEFPEQTTESAYDDLSSLADQLLINLHVCRVDNATVLFDLSQDNHSDQEYQNSFRILSDRQEADAKDKEKAAAAAMGPAALNIVKYCSLVDIATTVCCRTAIVAFEDRDWHSLIICSLAKYSAKLKVLAMDPTRFTQRSINMASRSKQYKAMLDGIGNTLRKMQENSNAWKVAGGKRKKKKKDTSSDDEKEEEDDDEDDEYNYDMAGGGLGYMHYGPNMPFGGAIDGAMGMGMGGMGMGMGNPMGNHMGMNNMGMGGMGMGMNNYNYMSNINPRFGVPMMGGGWFPPPLYSEARLKEMEAFTNKTQKDEGASYFAYMTLVNNWTSSTLLHLFQELKAGFASSDLPSDSFDMCSILYEAGTIDCTVPVLMHQDRRAELSGTNNFHLVQYAYMGFWLAHKAAAKFETEKKTTPRPPQSPGARISSSGPATSSSSVIRIDIHHEQGEQSHHQLVEPQQVQEAQQHQQQQPQNLQPLKPIELRPQNMAQVISIMLPLLCTSPDYTSLLYSSIQGLRKLFSIDVKEHLLPRPPRFTGLLSFRTTSFESRTLGCLPHSDFKSLSWSILAERDRHSTLALKHTTTSNWAKTAPSTRQQQVRDLRQRQLKLARDASQWTFEENAIRVDCPKYVYTVLGICITIAVGGLMLGIFLGTFVKESDSIALQGVDPFGFTSYSWIMAGFIMLIAKSTRVNEWPWRDFLLRRVTCRSLSELRSVTGVDEQDLLAYLLTTEYENVLRTTGPHNFVFMRRDTSGSAANGFSIDVKPQMRTLLAAGLVFVKVLVRKEPTLVVLDFRAGVNDGRSSIRHSGGLTNTDIYCRYPPGEGDRVQDVVLNQQKRHWDHMALKWDRILGIYHDWDRMVR